MGYDGKLLGVSVGYSSQESWDPAFTIAVKDRGDGLLGAVYSVYMWMSGGEIEILGKMVGAEHLISVFYGTCYIYAREKSGSRLNRGQGSFWKPSYRYRLRC